MSVRSSIVSSCVQSFLMTGPYLPKHAPANDHRLPIWPHISLALKPIYRDRLSFYQSQLQQVRASLPAFVP